MPKIRETADIAAKWASVTPARAPEYAKGVASPKEDWAEETAKAKAAYEEGVKAALARDAFSKGVRKAGTEKWAARATTLGAERFGPGVAAAGPAYAEGFAPYRETIARTTLPARGPTGSEANYERVKAMGKALHSKKISG